MVTRCFILDSTKGGLREVPCDPIRLAKVHVESDKRYTPEGRDLVFERMAHRLAESLRSCRAVEQAP